MTKQHIIFALFLISCVFFQSNVESSEEQNWKRVYLATYPRSGNHWMRFLIEEATGVATSSVYRDPDPQHDETVYPWGAYSIDGGYTHTARLPTIDDLIIVKTHFPALIKNERDQLPYLKTLRILRHPIDSFYSFYCYKYPPVEILPWDWIIQCCESWKLFQEYWDQQPDVITVRYEDLMNNPVEQLCHCFTNIGLPTENIEDALRCHPPFGEPLKHLNHYTEDQLIYIESQLSDCMKNMGYTLLTIEELNKDGE